MKRILFLILIIVTVVSSTALLSSCSSKKDDGIPDGLQLVRGGDDVGYYFYGPEGWTVANQGDISATYVSTVNYTSLTFVPLEQPKTDENLSYALYIKDLFNRDLEKYSRSPFSDFTLIESPKTDEASGKISTTVFGNAKEAYKFIFSYTYEGKSYTTMQIFSVYDGNVYLLTYNASNAVYMNDKSFYAFYLNDYIQPVIDNFKFTAKTTKEDKKDYPRDADGYMLVSRREACGFDMYVPEDYSVDFSEAIICVSKENGAAITMSAMINDMLSPHDNFLARKEKLEKLSDDGTVEVIVEKKMLEPDNAALAAEYEYKYTLFGTEYHVYQLYVIDGNISRDFFVYTFTCPESEYAKEIDEAKTIFSKIGF